MNNRLEGALKHPATLPTATGLLGTALGAVGGYLFSQWQAKKKREKAQRIAEQMYNTPLVKESLQRLNQALGYDADTPVPDGIQPVRDIESMETIQLQDVEPVSMETPLTMSPLRERPDRHDPKLTPEERKAANQDFINELLARRNTPPNVIDAEVLEEPTEAVWAPEQHNIFANSGDDWDLELELAKRASNPGEPFVIHYDEFTENDPGYSQSSLTYYVGDDTLVDEQEKPIMGHSVITGPLLFGHGSGDPNVVFVQNDHLQAMYEIIQDTGYFSVEVLGLQLEEAQQREELRHAANLRFRDD